MESTTKLNSKILSLESELAATQQKPSVEKLKGQPRPSQDTVMVVAAGEVAPPEDIINLQDGHNEEGP